MVDLNNLFIIFAAFCFSFNSDLVAPTEVNFNDNFSSPDIFSTFFDPNFCSNLNHVSFASFYFVPILIFFPIKNLKKIKIVRPLNSKVLSGISTSPIKSCPIGSLSQHEN